MRKSELTNSVFIVALADIGTVFLADFTVLVIVGYLSFSQCISIDALKSQIEGPNLIFITYPTAIYLLPVAFVFAAFFGIIFLYSIA